MIEPLHIARSIVDAFEDVKKTMTIVSDDQEYIDREYNDLTHALELINFNAVEGYKLAKQLQDNRQRRREAKNLKERLQPLSELMSKHSGFLRELKQVAIQIEQAEQRQANRQYRPRERADLFERGGATHHA